MSYTPRTYEEIVRDMLTTLTGGTVRESMTTPAGQASLLMPEKLKSRPVRRVSHLEGLTIIGTGANAKEVPYRFTAADFDLVSSTGDENDKDSIRFRENGRKPVPGSLLTVNYYPIQTDPVPLTDLNVGSVTRTITETIARELATTYQHLRFIYISAFLPTAEGDSLDKVVALVGASRLPAGHTVAKLRFSRQPGVPGAITIPSGTAVTDDKGTRYLTLADVTMEPNETTREVLAGGETPGTAEVEEGALNRPEILIAGISTVVNVQAGRRLTAPETDDELRRRARNALHGQLRGTCDALKFGLSSIQGVKDVAIEEAPNGVAGEVRLQIAFTDPTTEVKQRVTTRIKELRAAGIRVIDAEAALLAVTVQVELRLAGASLQGNELRALNEGVENRVFAYLSRLPPGGTARRAKILQAVLQDDRITDSKVTLTPQGREPVEELSLDTGQVLDIARPFTFTQPLFEDAAAALPSVSTVNATLRVHLVPGVTLQQASDTINLALNSYLATRRADAPLTVDGLAAAIRDDSRFALVRADVIVTVEGGGRFIQLTDGVGQYAPATNETLLIGVIDIQPSEGGV
jgi:uncharacterized phage protein gp47/JayE